MIARCLLALLWLLPFAAQAENRINQTNIKTLVTMVNQNWLNAPVMRLHSDDVLTVEFDELSHDYHRYVYRLEHCEADWTPSEELFESDWLSGFNGNPIEDYAHSINTIVPYTHYQLQLPNDRCQLLMSGNYRLYILDEDDDNREVLVTEFMVTEQSMRLSLSSTPNTDIDTRVSHQQVAMALDYGSLPVTNPDTQIYAVVMQNHQQRNMRQGIKPNITTRNGLEWSHNRELIFDAGNEYRKFEVLDVSHPTMGIDHITWDGENYQAYTFVDAPRPNYLYDEDANGAFCIRNWPGCVGKLPPACTTPGTYLHQRPLDYCYRCRRLHAVLRPRKRAVHSKHPTEARLLQLPVHHSRWATVSQRGQLLPNRKSISSFSLLQGHYRPHLAP